MHLSVGIMLSVSMLLPKRWIRPRISEGSDVDCSEDESDKVGMVSSE